MRRAGLRGWRYLFAASRLRVKPLLAREGAKARRGWAWPMGLTFPSLQGRGYGWVGGALLAVDGALRALTHPLPHPCRAGGLMVR